MVSYVLTFIEGLLTFISPCILPMLPIYFIYLAGTTEKASASDNGKKRMVLNAIGFVIGFTLVFVALGATASSLGHFLSSHRALLQKISGAVMVVFGLNFAGVLNIGFLNGEKRLHMNTDGLKFVSSILFGMVFGFGWTPCLGAFLGSALLLAGNAKSILEGMLLLLLYSAGLGIPFIVASLIFENIRGALRQIQKYSRQISIISGILLIIAGILIFADVLKYL